MDEVRNRLGLGRSSIYELVRRGLLCPPVHIGVRAVAWPESAVNIFIAERITKSRAKNR